MQEQRRENARIEKRGCTDREERVQGQRRDDVRIGEEKMKD
jgi:hypothetical protein